VNNHLMGWTDDMRQKERDEMLSCNVAKIRSFADLLEASIEQNHICAFGSATAINGRAVFGSIRRI